MANYGIKVSKKGFDVKTTAIENLSLHSEYQNYIIRKDGYASGSVTAGSTLTVSGGGTFYIDSMFLGFIEVDGNGKWFQPYTVETSSGGGIMMDLKIDELKSQALYADITATSGTHDVKAYMILLLNQTVETE